MSPSPGDPLAESRPAAAPRRRRSRAARIARSLYVLLIVLFLFLGFVTVSSLIAELTSRTWLRLSTGLIATLIAPLLLAGWGARRARARGRRGLPGLIWMGLVNLVLLLGAVLIAPAQTRAAVERHGAWWVEALSRALGKSERNAVSDATRDLLRWVAARVPRSGAASTEDRPSPTGTREAGAPRRVEMGPGPARDARARAGRAPETGAPAGTVRIAFERQGGAMIVPVVLRGSGGEVSAKMVFDTGASLTTVNEATLRQLGIFLAPGDPTVEVHTANGTARRSLAVIESAAVRGAAVGGGLTVAVCEPCAQGEVVGLLGMNFSSHFKVTLESAAGELLLEAKPAPRLADIRPWVELRDARGAWRGPLLSVDLVVDNRSPRTVRDLRVAAVVRAGSKEGQIWGELRTVPPRTRAPLQVQGLPAVRGATFQLRLDQADW